MTKQIFKPELLAPAGSFEQFITNITYGAYACYLGGNALNLRAKSSGFSFEDLERALKIAHNKNKKIYYCLNIFAQDNHLKQVEETLHKLGDFAVDGLIIADPGVVRLAKKILPNTPIHLSTQANTTNSEAVKFWRDQGVERVNLARELSLNSIKTIRQTVPKMELEVFVHGAMCMAISGRCFLSAYLNDRSANLGACTHPCRFNYKTVNIDFEEECRPQGKLWNLEEDENYSYFFSPDDLCLVNYLKWFCLNKIDAIKIEGRTKSSSYSAQVIDVYNTALSDIQQGIFRPKLYTDELLQVGTRDLGSGFFLGSPKKLFSSIKATKPIIARIEKQLSQNSWQLQIKKQLDTSNNLELMLPGLIRPLIKSKQYALENLKNQSIDIAHPGESVILKTETPNLSENLFIRLAAL
ncbi:MAG: U32 family peptidase [Gammaproteobacteria bacterium]|nr:U32 family peptidase [Gammaproteobacteria bacterium]